MINQHEEITLSFMIPGHTKFSFDWCFGLLKKKIQHHARMKVVDLIDLVTVFNESSVSAVQLTGL